MLLAGALVPALTQADTSDGWRHVWLSFAAGGALVTTLVLLFLRNPERPMAASTDAATGVGGPG